MPDIQTALKTALSRTLQQWDDDGEQVPQSASTISTTINNSVSQPSQEKPMTNLYNITNNVSRSTFNYVKNNPGSTRKEIIEAMEHQNYSKGSVSSLIAQMRRNNMIHETNNLYYADVDEYQPIKNLGYKKRKLAKAASAVTPTGQKLRDALTADAGIAALRPDTAEAPAKRVTLTTLVRTKEPKDILKDMTVYQAQELYIHLKQLFGG